MSKPVTMVMVPGKQKNCWEEPDSKVSLFLFEWQDSMIKNNKMYKIVAKKFAIALILFVLKLPW